MKKIMLVAMLFLFFVFPSVSALTLTQDTYPDMDVVDRSAFDHVSLTLGGAVPTYGYTIYGYIGCEITNYATESIVGQFFQRDVTGDGTYTFAIDEKNFPFGSMFYNVSFSARPYYLSNHTYLGTNTSVASKLTLDYGEAYHGFPTYHLALRDHSPTTLSLHIGEELLKHGTSLDVSFIKYSYGTCQGLSTYDEGNQFYVFVTDNSMPRKLLAYGIYEVEYTTDSESTLWATYHYNTSYTFVTTDASNYNNTNVYRIYYGILLQNHIFPAGSNPYHDGNVTIDNLIVETDDSITPTLFSITYSGGTTFKSTDTLTEGCINNMWRFAGGEIYVDARTNYISNVFTPGSLGLIVRNYGNDIGMPYFYLFIAFLIIAILVCAPYSFFIRYNLHPPNFIYSIFITAGVALDWSLGLLDLWMLLLYIVTLILIFVIRFREDIEKLATLRATLGYTKAKKEEVEVLKEKKHSIITSKDEGVKKPRKEKIPSETPGWHTPLPALASGYLRKKRNGRRPT